MEMISGKIATSGTKKQISRNLNKFQEKGKKFTLYIYIYYVYVFIYMR